ncbi:alanine--tRNA ligase [Kribbella turkmenica]|uniref:Alanine--tRNA ligase n=1 Tax=Kribbella turkmenica TaxID=2530375 RepID=A0A4R4XFI1_9ACTN|nr:alanine--tRNA ligase [Kribbella turkmenica]TDD29202.1 alanine--tRNA ligase [Kribbella turkmenica]
MRKDGATVQPMSAAALRDLWTRFWTAKAHTQVTSSSLIPFHPSAPMFTNAGMIQFVPYFLGEVPVPYSPPRVTSVQRCVRAGGKHNDLDAIGRSLRHLSFFEMLGNFSFGDYSKQDAILWAWEFVTEVVGIDSDHLWVTVHESDDEAADIWSTKVGLPSERIQRLDKDNFWEMGDIGPCGPCTELFYDFGPDFGPPGGPANPESEQRYVEFWNLVFMEQFRDGDGELSPLPKKHVDTGAGLERLAALLQGSPSLFACDTLSALLRAAEDVTDRRLGEDAQADVALRVIADHARTMTFLIADGVVPSNDGRGYVLRRIIRRSIRFAHLLGVTSAFTTSMADAVFETMGAAYPELMRQHDLVESVLRREETQFRKTLRAGLDMLDAELANLADAEEALPGKVAFTLHDTFGFPLDVTVEIVSERGRSVDLDEFERLMDEQRARGRRSRVRAAADDPATFQQALAYGPTDFVGRETYETRAHVIGVANGPDSVKVMLDRSPFFAEQGGQVGDTGVIVRERDGAVFEVKDTVFGLPGLHLHLVEKQAAAILSVGDEVRASIDADRRDAIRRNHTGTHLLQWALRTVLGPHVAQQGSLVAPDRLRFDFSHFEPVTADQLREVEDLVNREVLSNAGVTHYESTYDEAVAQGALRIAGETYSDNVLVLQAGPHSLELCGGTHVAALGQVGTLKIVSESSIGSNLRRIEAVTGAETIRAFRALGETVVNAAAEAGVPATHLLPGLSKRMADLRAARAEVRRLSQQLDDLVVERLLGQVHGGALVNSLHNIEVETLRRLAVATQERGDLEVVVLGSIVGDRPIVVATVAPDSDVDIDALLGPLSRAIGAKNPQRGKVALMVGVHAQWLDAGLMTVRKQLISTAVSVRRSVGSTAGDRPDSGSDT